jgi:hypothetical protein
LNTKQEAWENKTVHVDELSLDLQNPRIPEHVKDHDDASTVRTYLLDKENVLSIARSISNSGYHRSATSIVYEDKGKYIVLDGNRRLAACQMLLDPSLISNSKDRSRFSEMKDGLGPNALANIPITIAPSRKAAEKEIWDIHVSKLAKPWQVLQQLRMYRNLIGTGDLTVKEAAAEYGITVAKFKKELAKLHFYEQILQLTDDAGEEQLLKSGFNKIDRLMLSDNGKKLLDYDVNDKGVVSFKDKKEATSHIKKLVPFVVDPTKITAQVKQDYLVDKVYSEIDPLKFPKSGKSLVADPTPPKQSDEPTIGVVSGTNAKKDWITDSEYKAFKGADKIKDMLGELKRNPPVKGQNLNIVAISLRILVELAAYDTLSQNGAIQKIIDTNKDELKKKNTARAAAGKPLIQMVKNWTPSLKEMLNYMSEEASGIVSDPQQRKFLENFINKQVEFVNDMDNFIHNVHYRPSETAVTELWDSFCRPVFDILNQISNSNKNDQNKDSA